MEFLEELNTKRKELLDRLESERLELRSEMKSVLKSRVFQHGETLLLKQRQLVYKDHYGNDIFDKFLIERDYFVKTVLTKDIPQSIWELLFPLEDPAKIFHEIYGEFIQSGTWAHLADFDIGEGMSPQEFEVYCCEILRQTGWEARTTSASGDQGIDIIATWGNIKLVVQCKLYSSPVGNAAVQETIAGRAFEKADYAAVVSNVSYTPAAMALASATNVLLLNYAELSRLHVRLGLGADVASDTQRALPSRSLAPSAATTVLRPMNEIAQQAELLNLELKSASSSVDALYAQAIQVVIKHRMASISLIQRQLRIGYNRAANLLEIMERDGLISKMAGTGLRELTGILAIKESPATGRTDPVQTEALTASLGDESLRQTLAEPDGSHSGVPVTDRDKKRLGGIVLIAVACIVVVAVLAFIR